MSQRPNIALYEPDIPQNTAAIIRTCACLGAKLEIIEPCGFHLSDKRFKRVVMDYMDLDKIEIHQSAEKFFEAKKNHRVVLMTTKASISYLKFKFEKNDTILFGRESAGVPESIHQSINDDDSGYHTTTFQTCIDGGKFMNTSTEHTNNICYQSKLDQK